jgi:hypothetical protein
MIDIGQKGDVTDPDLREWLVPDELFGSLDKPTFTLSPGNRRPPLRGCFLLS